MSDMEELEAELHRLKQAGLGMAQALNDSGPNPEHHAAVKKRHRKEWPVLWQRIDKVLWELTR